MKMKFPFIRRHNSKILTYKELNGAFNINKAAWSILGTKTLAYNMPDNRSRQESHGEDGFDVGPCYLQYCLIENFITATRNNQKTQSARFYPMHYKPPAVSEDDKTILAACEMLKNMKIIVPLAENKCRHAKILQQLTQIMSGSQLQRVATSTPPRVTESGSTSNNTTSPRVVKTTKQIHQRVTRSNTPMPEIMGSIEPSVNDGKLEKEIEKISRLIPLPIPQRQSKARKMNGTWIGSKGNNDKVASKKRITKLTNVQFEQDRTALANSPTVKQSYKTPQA